MSPGAVLASLFYFAGFGVAYYAIDNSTVTATKNLDETINRKKLQ